MKAVKGIDLKRIASIAALVPAALAALAPAAAAEAPAGIEWLIELEPAAPLAGPPLPPPGVFPVQLVIDDDSAEGNFGVADANGARQFLWFNRFTPPGEPFDLAEVWVLFPAVANVEPGDPVQLAIYLDPDGDPANGADLLATYDETIQVADGATFSVYPVAVPIHDPGDVLIGVVPRFLVAGDPPTGPASFDVTTNQQRSWVAIWTASPPDPPELPPDLLIERLDVLAPAAAGNFMIRGFGVPAPVVVIPALGGSGLALLALALGAAGLVALRRSRRSAAGVLGLVALAAAAALAPAPADAQVVIDELTTNQATISDPPGGGSTAVTAGADIVGGKRGLLVRNLAGPGPTSIGVAGGALDFSVAATTPDSSGEADVIWDGDADNDPSTLDPTGFTTPVDLTDGGTQGAIRFTVDQAQAGTHLVLTIYQDAAQVSRAGRVLPAIASPTEVFISFAELIADPGAVGPADLTQVGAITLRIGGSESPSPPVLSISHIETAGPGVAAAKVDTVGGVIVSGPQTPGTTLRYRVTIDNPGAGAAESVDFDDVIADPNLGPPSAIRTTPLARRDQYVTFTDGEIDSLVDGVPSLLANDADPDGDPLATVAAGDQVTAQGGVVSVGTDGHFVYTPPFGYVGVDAFNYVVASVPGDPTADAAGNPIGTLQSIAYITIDRVPPEITAGGTLLYTENDPPSAIDPALTVVDLDSVNLFGATVEISVNYVLGEDLLGFVNTPNITGVFVPATGVLTLTGTDTVAAYEAALRSVTYENTSEDPSELDRTVTWTATDGGETSAPATSTIEVTSVNDAPIVTTSAGTTSFTEDGGPVTVDSMLTVTDADHASLASATVTVTNLLDAGLETLAANTGGTSITALYTAPTLSLTGSDTVANYQQVLRSVTYDNASQDPSLTDRVIRFVAHDGTDPSAPADKTVTITPQNDPPVAGDDLWHTIGNTQLVVDLAALPTPHVLDTTPGAPDGVRDNDADPVENDNHLVTGIVGCGDITTPFVCPTANGGTVSLDAVGTFTYTPAAGDTAASDSFQYILTDDGFPAPASDVGTVTIQRFERVWYVDNDFGAGGNGTSASPFNTLAALNGAGGAGDSDSPNDYLFVHFGDGMATGQAAGLVLENGQHLLGEHAGLSIPVDLNGNGAPTVLHPGTPGSRPLISHTGAGNDAISAANAIPAQIRGLRLSSAAANAIDVTTLAAFAGSGALAISGNVVEAAGAEGIDVNAGGTGTLTLQIQGNAWAAAGVHTGNAIDVARTGGTLRLDVSDNAGVRSAAAGISISGGSAASTAITGFANNSIHPVTGGAGIAVSNATFDATPLGAYQQVAGGTTVIGASGDGVGGAGLTLTGVAGDLAFTDLDVFAGGTGVSIGGTGAVNVAAGTGTRVTVGVGVGLIEATGPAIELDNLTADFRLTSVTSAATGTRGISLVNVADAVNPAFEAAFSAGAGSSITAAGGAAGPLFNVSGGNAAIGYAGAINNNGSGRAVSITTWAGDDAGDDLTLSGAIDENGAGILVNANAGARAIRFTGGMDVDTTTGEGFAATSNTNALGLHVTGTNDLSSVSATALRVTNTTIGNSNLNFRRIDSGNNTAAADPASGIVLSATGSTGRLIVTGTGASGQGGNGTGGLIQSTTSHGVSLNDTTNPSFTNLSIQNTSGSGINGTLVAGFTFDNGTINNSGTGGAADDSNISFNDSLANANVSGTVTVTDSVLTNSRYHGVDVQHFNGTIAHADIQNNAFTSAASIATSLGSAIRLDAFGTAAIVGHVTRATINNNVITNFPTGAGIHAFGGNSSGTGPAGTFGVPGSGTDVIAITNNRMNGGGLGVGNQPDRFFTGGVNGSGQGNFNISNNGTVGDPIRNIDGVVVELNQFGTGSMTATVNNNVIVANNAVGSAGINVGCDADGTAAADNAVVSAVISGNNVSDTDGPGIFAIARGSSCSLTARILGNTVAAPDTTTAARAGIRVDSGSAVGDTTLCLEMTGNTTAGSTNVGTATTSPGINLRKQGTDPAINVFGIEGLSPSPTGTPNVENHVNGLNTSTSGTFGVNGTALLSATSGFTSCVAP